MWKRAFRFGPVFAAVILMVTLGSCSWITNLFWMGIDSETHPVVIGAPPQDPSFTPDPVTVNPLDFIQWSHDFSETVVVELQGVPVTPKRLVLPEGVTGRVMVWDTASAGHYKYVVKVVPPAGDTIVFDPYIDVEEEGRRGGGS